MIKGRNILPELDLSCSTNYGHGAKKKKKTTLGHSCMALVCEIKFHSIEGRWSVVRRRLDCLIKHPSILIFTDAGISLLWRVWYNQLVLKILVPQHTTSGDSDKHVEMAGSKLCLLWLMLPPQVEAFYVTLCFNNSIAHFSTRILHDKIINRKVVVSHRFCLHCQVLVVRHNSV